ncbi:MAG: prolipoprotein diacylglyceryl transferase [Deltaproteobacteria bacterium]|nr:MAG: prolipoprotein diacylglyceryl transferase [Deltaproteobacteria bacterium]
MLPTLFEYGPLVIYTYGTLILAAILSGWFIGLHLVKRSGINQSAFKAFALLTIISAILGARLFYVLLEWDTFLDDPALIFEIWQGGMVYYGGLLGAMAAGFIYLKNLPRAEALTILDITAPSIAIAHAVGRLGCFAAGCCYGSECSLPWAVTFTDLSSQARLGVPLNPVQLYEAAVNFLLFLFVFDWQKRRKHLDGAVFAGYLLLYPLFRFVLEFYRGDERGAIWGLSTSQLISIPLFFAGAALLILFANKSVHANSE